MNNIIEYTDDFAIVKEKDFGEPVGEYRVIRYTTGYYALQKCNVIDNTDDIEVTAWETICISPYLDDPLTPGRVWDLTRGKLSIEILFHALEDSCKLHNNELIELHLTLNPALEDDINDEIVEIIKKSDGDEIKDSIIESIKLHDDWVQENYETKEENIDKIISGLIILILILLIGLIICFISMGLKYYGVF